MVSATQLLPDGKSIPLPEAIVRAAGIEPGDKVVIQTDHAGAIQIRLIPRMTLDEWLERFRSDESYDEDAVREAAEDEAAREAMGFRGE